METEKLARAYPFEVPDRLDVDPVFGYLQKEEPVSRIQLPYGGEAWLVTKYEDVKTVVSDRRFSRASVISAKNPPRVLAVSFPTKLGNTDPPEHTRLRKLVAGAFTVHRIQGLRPQATKFVEEQLNLMEAEGSPGDIIEKIARPLPVTMISEIMGLPHTDLDSFVESAKLLISTDHSREENIRAVGEVKGYLAGIVAQRCIEPTDDLIGILAPRGALDDPLTEEEVADLVIGLLLAGFESTSHEIANCVYLLLTKGNSWEKLAGCPELLPKAIEEMLRYIPLVAASLFPRIAVEDVILSGTLVKAGEAVFVYGGAANRDESVFSAPDEFDIHRTHNPHIAFGYGAHRCIGASLARLELQTVLSAMLSRFPNLKLAVPVNEVQWGRASAMRGPLSLPVAW